MSISTMWLLVARNLGWENVNLTRFNVVRRLDVVAGNEAKMRLNHTKSDRSYGRKAHLWCRRK